MKLSRQFLLLFVLFLSSQCKRDKCETYSGRLFGGRIDQFFGAYTPRNSWIYHNRDSTKTDSVYILSFVDSLLKNDVDCIAYSVRRFNLHSTQLANGNNIATVYETNATATNFRLEAAGTGFPSFTSSTDSVLLSLPAADNPGTNTLDSIKLNGSTYYQILIGKKNPNIYYFGRDKGLVGWITPTDTFNLVRITAL